MPKVVKSTILEAPVERVWAVLRDFNGHDRWHPPVATSTIERGHSSDQVGCVRRFRLKDGSELREQLPFTASPTPRGLRKRPRRSMFAHCKAPLWRLDDFSVCFENE